jgi:hypothetical protein
MYLSKLCFRHVNWVLILSVIFSMTIFSCVAHTDETAIPANVSKNIGITTGMSEVAPSTAAPVPDDICIPPIEDIVYSTDPDPAKPTPGENLIVTPPSPWKMISPLPEKVGRYYQFSRTINDHVEIWIENPDSTFRTFTFLVYRTDTNTWETISAMISGSSVAVGRLFIARDGSLWGASGSSFTLPSMDWKSPLAKYNEETEKFEFVNEAGDIPAGRTNPDEVYQRPFWSIVLQDSYGAFWILAQKDAIYKFDPITYQSERYIDMPTVVVMQAVISPNDEIYYLLGGTDSFYIRSINDWEIFRLDTKNKKTERIGVGLEPWPDSFTHMLVDHKGELWLDGLGFRKPDGKWYQIQRSPVFITNTSLDSIDYRWKKPVILLESSDGRLWFDSPNGTTWLDLRKGKWCWFTTYRSEIVEDSDHNLWMVADNKLYKLSLEQ